MPVIDFIHEESDEIISVLVPLTAPAAERQTQTMVTEVDGKRVTKVYRRIWSAPQVAKDIRPSKEATQKDFDRMVSGKKGLTVGDAWDTAKELSEKRAQTNGGVDEVREQFYKDYQKKTGGAHIDVRKREAMKKAKQAMTSMGIRVE